MTSQDKVSEHIEAWKNDRYFADNILKWISRDENVVMVFSSMQYMRNVYKEIIITPVLAQVMAWCCAGDAPSAKATMAEFSSMLP